MNLFKGCLLACDVDGTLLENGIICKRNIDKINYFLSEGGIFSLATGRSVGAVSDVLKVLPDLSPSVMANGCMIYDFKEDKIPFQFLLDNNQRFIVKNVLENFPKIGIEVHSGKDVLTLNRNFETDDHQIYEKINILEVDFETATKYNWNKVLYAPESEKDLEDLKMYLSQYSEIANFYSTGVFLDGRVRHYCEQVPFGVSKQTGVKKLCELMNIKKGCCYAIGDYYNDVEIITCADIGATLSTSPEEIKQKADVIVGDVKNGAVADFIEHLKELRKE
ncbi:MAG: HAD family hydrolase [Clostridia bacterium]|nr:HAD family hydrolase [Clostridia bacterium]